jgi:ATP-binding cassette subfamily B protein
MNSNFSLPRNLSSFIWHFLKPYKTIVLVFVCLGLLAGCWGPFNSMLIKHIVNVVSAPAAVNIAELAWPLGLLVLNFVIFDNVTWRGICYLQYKYQAQIKNQIISETFQYILGCSHQFFQDNLSGKIAKQIFTLGDNVERIINPISTNFLRGFALMVVALISFYYVNPILFGVLAAWLALFLLLSIGLSKRLIKLSDLHANKESEISGQLVDSVTNNSNIRAFANYNCELSRMEQFLLSSKAAFQKKELYFLVLNIIQGSLITLMFAFMGYFLIHLYQQQLVTAGDFAMILGLSMEVGHLTWFTMSQVDEFNQAVGRCKQSLNDLMVTRTIQDQEDAKDLIVTKGNITFAAVKFHYQSNEVLFQNMSLEILAGQKIGLVGYSGGGKTSFVNLILRLYDINEGRILIDNQNIKEVTQESLRRAIAMIPQDPVLFHRTLLENIRYGRIEATDEEVIAASKRAYAHEFISKLPENYHTLVGERGIKLSGGQRQRIAIARAILKNAPILILDEATSQLDSVTEEYIQASLAELMQGKTTIVIAHRLSTLLHMDRILVFDQGKIIQDGTHAELLAQAGLYKTLWDAQVGGFLPDKDKRLI